MNRKQFILIILVAFSVTFVQAQPCTKNLPINVKNLTGVWVSMDYPYTINLQYKGDGTFIGNAIEQGKVSWRYVGKWWLIGNELKYIYTYSSLERIPKGTKDSDHIVSIGCGVLTIKTRSGNTTRYKKCQSSHSTRLLKAPHQNDNGK